MPKKRSSGTNGHHKTNGSLIRDLTEKEILDLIDQRARFLLGISGEEFMRRYRTGELEEAPAEAPITVLADLVAHR